MRTLHWSAVTAVISTVLLGNIKAKDLNALLGSHLLRSMGVPVNIGLSGSGLHACLTSKHVDRSKRGGVLLLVGSPCAGRQLKDLPSEWMCNTL